MLRRMFLQASVALAATPVFASLHKPVSSLTISYISYHPNNVMVAVVQGDPNEVIEFTHTFQTNLWPDWKTHPINDARHNMAIAEKSIMKNGKSFLAHSNKETINALAKTLQEWPSDIKVI